MPKKSDDAEPFTFDGFVFPTTTPVPDDVFDVLMPYLSEVELKVLLYIIRRTFGFKKESDAIAFSQLVSGITTRDGRVLDRGTGMSKSSVARGVKGLIDKGIIEKHTSDTSKGDSDINVYGLRYKEGVVLNQNHGSPKIEPRVVLNKNTQKTVNNKQHTRKGYTANNDLSGIVKTSRDDFEPIWLPPDDGDG